MMLGTEARRRELSSPITAPSSKVNSPRRHGLRATLLTVAAGIATACQPSTPAPIPAAGATITGTVVERVDGAPYSYLRLKTEQGEIWAAVPMESVAKGGKVTVKNGAPVKNFTAPGINRKFEVVVFGVVEKG